MQWRSKCYRVEKWMESVGWSLGMDMKGKSLKNWQGKHKKIKHKQTKQQKNQTNKQRLPTKIGSLAFFAFYAENSVNNQICVIKSKIVLPSFFFTHFPKCWGCPPMPMVYMQCTKNCNELRNGLRMSHVGPHLYCLRGRGLCVVRGLKLTIIGTWKFVMKSNCVYIYMDDSLVLSLLKIKTILLFS
jgi:hypothetical protein